MTEVRSIYNHASLHTGGIDEYILAMPHRGRTNLMSVLFKYPPVVFFRKMKGLPEFPNSQKGAGDVFSHLSKKNTSTPARTRLTLRYLQPLLWTYPRGYRDGRSM